MNQRKVIDSFMDVLHKNWNEPGQKLLTILEKQFKKLPGSYYEQADLLRSLRQDFENSRYNIEFTYTAPGYIYERGKESAADPSDENPDAIKSSKLKEWILKKYIHLQTKSLYALSTADIKIRNWIDLEYEIKYLQNGIKGIEDQLWKRSTSDEDNSLFNVHKYFRDGKYPNVLKENPEVISLVETYIAFRKFLKERLDEIQPSTDQQHLTIQGEIKGEKDNLGYLKLTLPLKHIEQSLKQSLKKEINITPVNIQKNEIKLYTLKETAEMLGVSLQTLNEWAKKGIIQKHRIGNKQIRIKREDIEKAIKKIDVLSFNPET